MLGATETITVYNSRTAGHDVQWSRVVMKGVSVFEQISSAVGSTGTVLSKHAIIRIPADAVFSDKKCFVPQEQWNHADSACSWTLKEGDRIARGEHPEIQKESDLRALNALTIQSWADNRRGVMPHWKVAAV